MRNSSIFNNYIINNKKTFCILIFFLILGLLIGIISVNSASVEEKNRINNYVTEIVNNIRSVDSINYKDLLQESIKNNLCYVLIVWLIGFILFGGVLIYFVLMYKGFSLGYTVSSIVASLGVKNGIVFSILSLSIQNVFFIIVMLFFSQKCLEMAKKTKVEKYKNIKKNLIIYTIISLIVGIFMIMISFIEVYVSNNLLILCKKIY